jgi:hypothetical protein
MGSTGVRIKLIQNLLNLGVLIFNVRDQPGNGSSLSGQNLFSQG